MLPLFLVVVFSSWEMIRCSVVCVACYLMALVFMHSDRYLFENFLMMFVDDVFYMFL